MPDTDDLTATLAEARHIADGLQFACRIPDKTPDFFACGGPAAEAYWNYFTPARISSLLAAIEAPLKLAGEWDIEAKRIDAKFAGEEDAWPRTVAGMRAQAFEQCAKTAREAIAEALAKGEGGTDG